MVDVRQPAPPTALAIRRLERRSSKMHTTRAWPEVAVITLRCPLRWPGFAKKDRPPRRWHLPHSDAGSRTDPTGPDPDAGKSPQVRSPTPATTAANPVESEAHRQRQHTLLPPRLAAVLVKPPTVQAALPSHLASNLTTPAQHTPLGLSYARPPARPSPSRRARAGKQPAMAGSEQRVVAVIMVGGPTKGTRFRPLSLNVPKPLFPLAGQPMVHHPISACRRIPNLAQIYLIGFYEEREFALYVSSISNELRIPVRYLREDKPHGSAGGLYSFRDYIMEDSPSHIVLLNCDVCSSFPLPEMLEAHKRYGGMGTLLVNKVSAESANQFGELVADPETNELLHYTEKPETFVSDLINCGVYIFTPNIFNAIEDVLKQKKDRANIRRVSSFEALQSAMKYVSMIYSSIPFPPILLVGWKSTIGKWSRVQGEGDHNAKLGITILVLCSQTKLSMSVCKKRSSYNIASIIHIFIQSRIRFSYQICNFLFSSLVPLCKLSLD
uniref:Uncharacterized protein n=1 Tax=Avena sativa TaxID=4498 RepID=A0ACD5TVU6_AVESA